MLKEVVEHINNKIKELNIFNTLFNVCELVEKDGATFPAYWSSKSYKPVEDVKTSLIYHRLNGDITISQSDEESRSGCSINSVKSYPMRCVAFIKKDICVEGLESEESIALSIEKKISSTDNKELRDLLSAENVGINVSRFIFDRNIVYKEEYGSNNKIGFEYSYIAIEYTIEISIDLNCQTEITC